MVSYPLMLLPSISAECEKQIVLRVSRLILYYSIPAAIQAPVALAKPAHPIRRARYEGQQLAAFKTTRNYIVVVILPSDYRFAAFKSVLD
ncbi:hypothetical protein [Serratia sp. UGAL515B_01]|uniref:hypothetical protein n=1 Tax=Serratia sp. UGAL515B_01 TaxID=2986763 RepID=UPI002953CD41|nr:hypothetical protein [Serratia sp. UGAL515B_01]WON76583.1 hypothetical protein OK023_15455 [Serratia sp. UGAL515B_01]